ncbi:hypothetical protein [Microbispora sp. CA-102843]|uniref:hypothetical protein n=1 Tax=Microbispora sp. CA-102843 TaxID=3239952 RepID=UPI003D93F60C
MPANATPPDASIITAELRQLLRTGLPVSGNACGDALLDLPGVRSRAADPGERASRARALDGLLRWQLAHFQHTELADAARLLFGATRESAGMTLTERRTVAATAADYEVHHFRKRIEPKITGLLAWQLLADSENFAATRATAPALAPALTGPLRLPADVFAWEVAEHEEALSRLWSGVYALRADLLAVARLASMDAGQDQVHAAADAALRRYAELMAAASTYRAAYGDALLHADGPMPPEHLARLAGWVPPLTDNQIETLTAAAGHPAGVAAALARDPDLIAVWRATLTDAKDG